MPDMALIQSAITSLNTAANIAKGFLQLRTIAEMQGKVIELQSAILAAQSSALAAQSEQATLIQRISELEKEIARVKAWEGQKQRYKLHSPWEGATVYALKRSMCEGEPAHWICTHCYEDGRRSILQFGYKKEAGNAYRCPSCDAVVHHPAFTDLQAIPYAPE
jgi:hypothetical protein